jgi:selT/selW/selH-like putative selenoprotein
VSAEIAAIPGINLTLHAEGRGIFDVEVDGALIFSKYQVGRFPEEGEIAQLIQR